MRYFKLIILVFIFFFSMLFLVQNSEVINTLVSIKMELFDYRLIATEVPLYLLILGAFLLGAFFTLGYLVADRIKIGAQLREAKRKIASLEKELQSLRNIPLEKDSFSEENETSFSTETNNSN